MKTTKKRILSLIALAVTSLLVFSCHWMITSIRVSDNIKVNSTFDVQVTTNIQTPETDYVSNMIVMFCVPKSWNAQQTARVTFSTSGYPQAMAGKDPKYNGLTEFDHEELVPLTLSDLEASTGLPYSKALEGAYGKGGNFGDVEWVGFKTKDDKIVTDISNTSPNNFDIIIDATFRTDDVNYKFFLNTWASGKTGLGYPWGEGFGAYNTGVQSVVVEVTGGSGPKVNYTVPAKVSTVPTEFRFGDFFCVNFMTDLEGAESELKGKDVYLCGKAVFEDGSVVVVDQPLKENLMARKGDATYSKYILPCLFFHTPYEKKISQLYVWFTDESGSVVDYCGSEEGWEFSQALNE